MMSLDAVKLGKDILAALNGSLAEKWPDVKDYGEAEAKKLAQTLVMIGTLKATGKINKEQAELHLEMQKNATRMVLMTIEGLGILSAEAAINSALNTVKDNVNKEIGFTLL
ncbi:MAG: hypothetical protein LZF64_03150 [Nitrosomonas sp.]|uniref:hypothetical protein n=1 Tax=Nitrosomonas sp. TaxID=42353 RepID=UPI001A49378A|nr:hypothetical protein [Nitrosomonas sp.]MBL8501206.1 hypothetical protein [Nitrosomonas sp.]UJP00795.1 MAG: hypothetical protein LZF64_03150 [Nitrosomonas sp.]UJP03992.1 MAG: hypothetical protein LZF85_06025 [Nitrosomonas sp.]UJP07005.1 MAG: hypothetical protein LZF84_08070 [Nitrosomonas sp.]